MKIISYIILFVSCVLYIYAPNRYSYIYCLLIHNLFLLTSCITYISDIKNEKVGFNMLFTISFFFTNIVYPVYIYPIDSSYSLFKFPFNHDVITKCTALSQIAYSSYVCGYVRKLSSLVYIRKPYPYTISSIQIKKIGSGICLFVIAFILLGGMEYFEDRYMRGVMSQNIIVQYFMLFFIPIMVWFSSLILLCKRKVQSISIYLLLSVISLVLLISGTRTFPLIIFSSLFVIYCNKNKVSNISIIICIVIGVSLMSFIGDVRHEGVLANSHDSNASQFGWLEHFSDLFICNRGLYVFYDYINSHTYLYGLSMFSSLLSPIPFAQKIFIDVTGVPYYFLGSPALHTFLEFGSDPPLGLGTNIVGDVYLSFGVIGVLLLFNFLGRFIIKVRTGMWYGNYMYAIIYLILVSDAIYMCRASFLDPFRNIIWTLVIAWFFIRKKKKIQL